MYVLRLQYLHADGSADPAIHRGTLSGVAFVGDSTTRSARAHGIFGGGTPSLLNARQLSEILTTIADGFSLDAAAEITLEANPNDIDETYAREIRALGINRISLGMQSAQDHELRLFARRHGNEHLTRAVSAIRAAGFDDFNLDLIFGIPHQRLTEWRDSLQQALRLGPTHLSLYALSLEVGTPLRDWVARGELPEPDDDCNRRNV